MMKELIGLTALNLVELVREREVQPREVVEAHLRHTELKDAEVGAFQLLRSEPALEEAAALTNAELADLPLAGLPVAIKDNVDVKGEPTRDGSAATSAEVRPSDHEVVRRLKAAGAIVIGKTRVPELCVWGVSDGPLGTARNPWDLTRTPGGSSGGSGAALAAAMVPLAHGTDGLGSIRIPAAACGLFGMKPGTGVVPAMLGVSSWFEMSENGPLATSVRDAALMLSVMAGDPSLRRVEVPERPLRIALSLKSPALGVKVDPEYRGAAVTTAALLAAAGHQVTAVDPAYPPATVMAVFARWVAGTAEEARALDPSLLQSRTKGHVRAGRALRRAGRVRAKDKAAWQAKLHKFFADHDVLLTPALAQLPIAADGWAERSWRANLWANMNYAPFAAPWNLAGFPAATVPAGMHPSGLPLAIQLVGPKGSERTLLSLALQIESDAPWERHAPLGAP
jgi:amidase